jgi:hypothetical protein
MLSSGVGEFPLKKIIKTPRRNFLVHLDSNVLHLVLDWLNVVDIGNFDMAALDQAFVLNIWCVCVVITLLHSAT